MKRLSISLVAASAIVLSGLNVFGAVLTPQPQLRVIATVVAHAHHDSCLRSFVSATDKL